MSNTTLLKVNLSKYISPDDSHPDNPDDDYDVRPVDPDTPNTDQDIDTGDHGFFTVSDNPNQTSEINSNLPTVAFVSFLSFSLILLFGLLLPKVVRKIRSNNPERYDLRSTYSNRFSFLSIALASFSLLLGLVSTVVAYSLPTVIETRVSESLTINADIIGTNSTAYVHDTITIPASEYGYKVYISTDDSEENRLIGDSTEDVINSITTDGVLTNNSYGFTFDNPTSDNVTFHPIQKKEGRTSVLSLSPEETKKEQKIDIWYGVRAKDLEESVYRTNIEYTTIDDHDLTLEEMTPEICANLEEGILDYTFRSSIDDKDYSVYKLKDGNCWTKEVPESPIDPDDPSADIPTICPTGWHEAIETNTQTTIDNKDALDFFYDVNNPDSETDERIIALKENSCVADYLETTFTFDLNGGPDSITMPNPETIASTAFETTYTLPNIPDDPLSEHFRGWSLKADDENPPYHPGDTITFTSPDVIFYAIWDEKIPKAILDEDGLLNFVYDYYSVEDVINDVNGYRTVYETAHAPIKTEGVNCDSACVYLIRENLGGVGGVPWTLANASNPDVSIANFEDSFINFKPTSTAAWFYRLSKLNEIKNLKNLNTSNTTSMSYMFEGIISLTSLTLPEGFGNQAIYMTRMFFHTSSLTSLTLPEGFGSKATNMNTMFGDAYSLTSLEFPAGFGSQAKDMHHMFQQTSSLTSLEFPAGFGSQAKDMSSMFLNASALASLEFPAGFGSQATNMNNMFAILINSYSLSSLEFPADFGSQATDMSQMFYGARALTSLELPEGFGSKADNMRSMFFGASSLEHIYVSAGTDWSTKTPAVLSSENMFSGATHLPGYGSARPNDITLAYEGEKDGIIGYFEDIANKPVTLGASSNSINPSYSSNPAESTIEPTEPSTEPNISDPSEENTEPYGAIRKDETTNKTDYALIIVITTSIILTALGTLIILLIEKRAREDEEFEEY